MIGPLFGLFALKLGTFCPSIKMKVANTPNSFSVRVPAVIPNNFFSNKASFIWPFPSQTWDFYGN